MRRHLRWILIALALVVVVGTGLVLWGTRAAEPMPEALAALQPDAQVKVETSPWYTFQPRDRQPAAGFIIYPGGLVDPRAYAPQARAIAARGYLVVIVPMPLNLAFFDAGRAQEVIAAFPSIRHWAIGGHSLGGVAASMFVENHPDAVQGLVLWASYPPDAGLANKNINVISIYGSRDQLATPAKIAASHPLVPPSTRWVEIDGGNHGQFGWYGLQSGDGVASISREQQQEQVVNATMELLAQIKGDS